MKIKPCQTHSGTILFLIDKTYRATPLHRLCLLAYRIIYVSITIGFAASTYSSLFQTKLLVEPQARELIAKWLEGQQVVKIIFIQDKMISFVVNPSIQNH